LYVEVKKWNTKLKSLSNFVLQVQAAFSYLGGKRKLSLTKSCFEDEELEELSWEKKNSNSSHKQSL
jgi:hypothetical protein